jgi:hypothetical protein
MSNDKPINKISKFNRKEITDPNTFFHLIYTFSNNDFLFKCLTSTIDLKDKFEIRKKINSEASQLSNSTEEFETKLEFELDIYQSYFLINDLLIVKYEEFINIYEFTNDNTAYALKQQIVIDTEKPSICFNGFFMKVIKQNEKYENKKDIIDILIQPNRKISNYFRIYRINENNNSFNLYKKIIINDGDDPGFIFIYENNLFSFVEKATDSNNKKTKSYLLKYDLYSYEKKKKIIIKDLKKFNTQFGFRQELVIYKECFLYIYNKVIKIFSMKELENDYFQIVNSRNIKFYEYSSISHIDNSLFIAQSNDVNGSKTYIKQYTLNNESLELIEIDSIIIEGLIKDIYKSYNGYVFRYLDSNNDYKYILLYK